MLMYVCNTILGTTTSVTSGFFGQSSRLCRMLGSQVALYRQIMGVVCIISATNFFYFLDLTVRKALKYIYDFF